jgi:hypothetical protein
MTRTKGVIFLPDLSQNKIEKYLRNLHQKDVDISYIGSLQKGMKAPSEEELKGYGYGNPVLIEYVVDGEQKKAVLNTMRPGYGFGHDHFSDRAQSLIWAHNAFNKLPNHVFSLDVGAFTQEGELISNGQAEEFFQLVRYEEGTEYFLDLEKIKETDELTELDIGRALALSNYLVEIHKVKKAAPELYVRRIRDLLGHGECIMGLLDSYPKELDFIDSNGFAEIEKSCVDWRWRIKHLGHRLCQEHGDYHPWNILFHKGTEFSVLDRSRGEWGEAADDVAAMSINYIFYALQERGKFAGPFEKLYNVFVTNYLEKTGDREMLSLIQPFYVWRALVIANPVWYPNLEMEIRKKIFNFIFNILDVEVFEIGKVNEYLAD